MPQLIGDFRPAIGRDENRTARDLDLAAALQCYGVAGARRFVVPVRGEHPLDPGRCPVAGDADRIAAADAAAGDGAGKAPEFLVRPVDPLNRKPEQHRLLRRSDLDGSQMPEQRRSAAGHVAAARDDVVAELGGIDRHDGAERKVRREAAEVGGELIEHALRMADEVHLVDGEHDMAMPSSEHHGVAPLRQYVLRVDQDDGGVGIRGVIAMLRVNPCPCVSATMNEHSVAK